jgi:hypothetical protein
MKIGPRRPRYSLSIVSAKRVHVEFPVTAHFLIPVHFESNLSGFCIQSGSEIAVASDPFDGTLLTSLLLLYECTLSFFFSLGHNRRLLVDNCFGAKPAEHHAAAAFSDHE